MTPIKKVEPKIVERIRKCLKLADKTRGATEAEAETAMAMARKLMDEHNIKLTDVQMEEEVKEGARSVHTKPKAFVPRWEKRMARVCDFLFGTEHYFSVVGDRTWTGGKTKIVFIGVGQDPDVASESYAVLCSIVRKMGSAKGLSGSDHRDYCLGVAETLSMRAHDIMKASEAKPEMSSCRDLVITKKQLVKTKMNELDLGKERSWEGRYSQHYQQGRTDGHKINLGMRRALK